MPAGNSSTVARSGLRLDESTLVHRAALSLERSDYASSVA
jgi:hypothetical protein